MLAGEVLNHRITCTNSYRMLTIFHGVQTIKDVEFCIKEVTLSVKILQERIRKLLRDIMVSALLRARLLCPSISRH